MSGDFSMSYKCTTVNFYIQYIYSGPYCNYIYHNSRKFFKYCAVHTDISWNEGKLLNNCLTHALLEDKIEILRKKKLFLTWRITGIKTSIWLAKKKMKNF